jgi:hypothetical protein
MRRKGNHVPSMFWNISNLCSVSIVIRRLVQMVSSEWNLLRLSTKRRGV